MSAILSLLGLGWLKTAGMACLGVLGGGALLWLRGKSGAAQVAKEERHEAVAIAVNHAVEQKETAAITDGDADAALNAASDAVDHK